MHPLTLYTKQQGLLLNLLLAPPLLVLVHLNAEKAEKPTYFSLCSNSNFLKTTKGIFYCACRHGLVITRHLYVSQSLNVKGSEFRSLTTLIFRVKFYLTISSLRKENIFFEFRDINFPTFLWHVGKGGVKLKKDIQLNYFATLSHENFPEIKLRNT